MDQLTVLPLQVRGSAVSIAEPIVGTVSQVVRGLGGSLLVDPGDGGPVAVILADPNLLKYVPRGIPAVVGISRFDHLSVSDVVAIRPNGMVDTLFQGDSPDNSLFVTDRCNSNCLMCSQPPKDIDDLDFHMGLNEKLIPLIPRSTHTLGITGGEPTLLGRRLLKLFRLLGEHLPNTRIHMLTNGRAFAWPQVPRALARVISSPTVFGVPLYSDVPRQHDYVVQAADAFHQTLLGLHNLARYGLRSEIRVVLHAQTIERLVPLARFIHKNVPFAEHVAFMGLEYTGYTPHNADLLWIEPEEYMSTLEAAVHYLVDFGFNVSVYNLPLCLVSRPLWPFARSSISQWKRIFLPECSRCAARRDCGGLFGTSKVQSSRISPIPASALEVG